MRFATSLGPRPTRRSIRPVSPRNSKAANKWNTSEGGSWYSIGVGGDILGRGAHIALIDDPFGSMADARSPTMRENVWNWYNGSLYNRMEPDGAIVIIGHRMHEDDLQGRLEERMRAGDEYADQWTIVELPAVAGQYDQLGRAPGEALWPDHFSLPRLERIRFNSLARNWSALYQQRPTPEEGELFSVERVTMRDHTSDVVFWVRGWDLAGSVEGDWSVGVLMGRTRDGKFVIGDVRRLRGRPDAVQGRAICGRRRASSAWPAGRHRTSDHGVCEGRYSPYPHLDPQRPGTGRCRPGSVADKDAGGLHRAVEPGDGRQADQG